MEKININDFAKICTQKMHFLCDKYNYALSETTEKSQKEKNGIVHKLIFTNNSFQRSIEIVLMANDYTTHMFSRIAEVYIKRILTENDNYTIPDYYDAENCLEIYDIEKILPQEKQEQLSLMRKKIIKNMYDYLDTIKYIIENSLSILQGCYFPTLEDLSKNREWKYEGRIAMPYIEILKETIKEVENFDYKIIFDETKLPPYERSFMGPAIKYFNNKQNILIDVLFQTRDQEFYVSKNKKEYWHYGRTVPEEYKKLEQKMIDEVTKNTSR
jgi:hypothetical protein